MSYLSITPSDSASNAPHRHLGTAASFAPHAPPHATQPDASSAIGGPNNSSITTDELYSTPVKQGVDFISHNVQLLHTRTVSTGYNIPVRIWQLRAHQGSGQDAYSSIFPPAELALDDALVERLTTELVPVCREIATWGPSGRRHSPDFADPCSANEANAHLIHLDDMLPADGGNNVPAELLSWAIRITNDAFWTMNEIHLETMRGICLRICQFLAERAPQCLNVLQGTPTNRSYRCSVEIQLNGAPRNLRIYQRRVVQVWWIYTLLCHTPNRDAAVAAVGNAQADDYLRYLHGAVRHVFAGRPLSTFESPDELPEPCRDPLRERDDAGSHKWKFLNNASNIDPSATSIKLVFSIEAVISTIEKITIPGNWLAGPLIHFTLQDDEIDSMPIYQFAADTLATESDLAVLDPNYMHLAANPNDLVWKKYGERTNAKFFLGQNEMDVTVMLPFVQLTTQTWDITGLAIKCWMWLMLRVQIQGIQDVCPLWDYASSMSEDFPRVVVFRDDWSKKAPTLAEMRRLITHSPIDATMVVQRKDITWDFISMAICALHSWPPSMPGIHHVMRNCHASELFNHLIPKAAGIRIPTIDKETTLILINSDLYDSLRQDNQTHEWVDITWQIWNRRSNWPMSNIEAITTAMRAFARDSLYTSHFSYAAELAVLGAFGPEIQRSRDGRCLLSPTTILTTDNIVLPCPKLRPPLCKFFTQQYNNTELLCFADLDAMTRPLPRQIAYAVVAQAAVHAVAAQDFHYSCEFVTLAADLKRSLQFHRPSLKVSHAVYRGCRIITAEDNGFAITQPSEYWTQYQYHATAITGLCIPHVTACRVKLWSAARVLPQRSTRELYERGIMKMDRVHAYIAPDAILPIAYRIPASWPLVLADTNFAFINYTRQEPETDGSPLIGFSTALPTYKGQHALCRNDLTMPAARYFSCVMHLKTISYDLYKDAGNVGNTAAETREIRVPYWVWPRGPGPRLPALDTYRTYDLQSAIAYEFSAHVPRQSKNWEAYVLGQHLEKVPVGLPYIVTPAVTPITDVNLAYRQMRALPTVKASTEDGEPEMKRLKAALSDARRQVATLEALTTNREITVMQDMGPSDMFNQLQNPNPTTQQLLQRQEQLTAIARQDEIPPTEHEVRESTQAPITAGPATVMTAIVPPVDPADAPHRSQQPPF